MNNILVTQRIIVSTFGERRDSLDQNWIRFLYQTNLLPILLPNHLETVRQMVDRFDFHGILLTGGEDLAAYGGSAPERDEVENFLLTYAISNHIPLLGVCRGMQMIQHFFGIPLSRVEGHVQKSQTVFIHNEEQEVNSYHRWGTTLTNDALRVWSTAKDGVIKAISHHQFCIHGIMWHPERFEQFRHYDRELFAKIFMKGGNEK